MLKATRRRLGSPALLAVGLIILVPTLAEAQLFPNRTIRREKPSCATEPPFYKQVRRDYFGYYPTCWSRFPAGWGCPCPDPDLVELRAKFESDPPKVDRKPGNGGTEADAALDGRDKPADDMGTDPKDKPVDPGLPLPPTGTSPFEMDPKTPTPLPRGTAPGIPGGGNPATPPGAGASSSMLDLPSLPSTSPSTSVEPAVRPGALAMYPEEATLTSASSNSRPDLGPLPTAPLPAPTTPEGGVGFISASTPTSNGAETVLGTPVPAQAPKRRSLLGQLFGRRDSTTQNR